LALVLSQRLARAGGFGRGWEGETRKGTGLLKQPLIRPPNPPAHRVERSKISCETGSIPNLRYVSPQL
jgi:hypothetical protein